MRELVLIHLWRLGVRRLAASLMLAATLSLVLHAIAPAAAALAAAPCHGAAAPAVAHGHGDHGVVDHGLGDQARGHHGHASLGADPRGHVHPSGHHPTDGAAADGFAHPTDGACCSISCAFAIATPERGAEGRTPVAMSHLPASSPWHDGRSPDGLKRPPRTACTA